VVTGLAALVLSHPPVRAALLWASAAYLVWLAARIAFAGSRIAFIERPAPPGVRGGVMLQAINPKAYAVTATLFTGFAFWPGSPGAEIAVKLLIVNLVWIPIHFLWLAAGVSLRRLDLPPRVQFAINLVMAASMLAVVALAALAQR